MDRKERTIEELAQNTKFSHLEVSTLYECIGNAGWTVSKDFLRDQLMLITMLNISISMYCRAIYDIVDGR